MKNPSVLTIGMFDGVHRGHQQLLSHVRAMARDQGYHSGVVTFRNHPLGILRPQMEPKLITSLKERIHLIKNEGIDFVVPLTFDLVMSKVRAEQFLVLLREYLCMQGIVVGPDFAMGYRREGTAAVLAGLSKTLGFAFSQIEPVAKGHEVISSTAIRIFLTEGNLEAAAVMLGRRFTLTGRVVRGKGRGQNLGFPTANLDVDPGRAFPMDGVYATWAYLGNQRYVSATSIGTNPTFGKNPRSIEAFLIDFSGDLYGRTVTLEFVRFLRSEKIFSSTAALVKQIQVDVDEGSAILSSDPGTPHWSKV